MGCRMRAEPVSIGGRMNSESVRSATSPLRLWPAIALLAILWVFRFLPRLVEEPSMQLLMAAFFGPLICSLAILLWWVAASRATWRERVFGLYSIRFSRAIRSTPPLSTSGHFQWAFW